MSADPAGISPAQARSRYRAGLRVPTAGWSAGYAQANLIAVPRDYAYELLLFAQRNPKACPVLDVFEPGNHSGPMLPDGDIRTDVPAYRVYVDGELVAEPSDVVEFWTDDLVAFAIGCSFTFEAALQDSGVPVRHIEQGRNVPMYRTNRMCRPAGRMSGPLVVSMRPVAPEQVADAVRITSRYPSVHGAPVHVGDPAALGIADLAAPDFGDPVDIQPAEIPVFWACGVTPQAAVMQTRPPLAIGHAPGHMLITDLRDAELVVP
ncbi:MULTISPECIES: putative hydro-lyase [Mycolicibacterium]|uniref:putative hydro-lyase n=1 Tax=Mycolicibacterium TaxID=1866885 RepID=UPI001EF64D01|nr:MULTISPECIES: putative hydro-lyase [Mycolicibacterium]MCG7582535.1 putative hydro-lyase [Mycolicibacterium sp. OfavD-34-C]